MDPYDVREIVMVSQSLSIDKSFVTSTAIDDNVTLKLTLPPNLRGPSRP